MAPRTDPDEIAHCDDPVVALASQGYEVLMDHPDFLGACNRIVFRSMGLHPQTMVGGDKEDRNDFYHNWLRNWLDDDRTLVDLVNTSDREVPEFLTDDDPRSQLYFELLSQLITHVLAEMISSQKFRWTPQFADRLGDVQQATNPNQGD